MPNYIPPSPAKSFRIVLNLKQAEKRIDNILLRELRAQNDNAELKNISRTAFKELFAKGKILIKGQRAKPSSALAVGTTYVDILL
jgi:hypothetical protein